MPNCWNGSVEFCWGDSSYKRLKDEDLAQGEPGTRSSRGGRVLQFLFEDGKFSILEQFENRLRCWWTPSINNFPPAKFNRTT